MEPCDDDFTFNRGPFPHGQHILALESFSLETFCYRRGRGWHPEHVQGDGRDIGQDKADKTCFLLGEVELAQKLLSGKIDSDCLCNK